MRKASIKVLFFSLMILFFSTACGSGSSAKKNYTIAVDPSFFPLSVEGKQENIYVFIHDLFNAIAESEGVSFSRINVSWDVLLIDLQKNKYDGAVSSLMPYVFNLEKFSFSDTLLPTGPSLIVPIDASYTTLKKMKNMRVAVENLRDEQWIMQKYPDLGVEVYTDPAEALLKLANGIYDGVLLETIVAISYVNDLYAGRLKIAEGPLGTEGLKIVTKKDAEKSLVHIVNEGLAKVKKSGRYAELVKKWKLLPE